MADNVRFEGPEHGAAWEAYRRELTTRERVETEQRQRAADDAAKDRAVFEADTRELLSSTLSAEQIRMIRGRLIEACHGALGAERLIERALKDFGLTVPDVET